MKVDIEDIRNVLFETHLKYWLHRLNLNPGGTKRQFSKHITNDDIMFAATVQLEETFLDLSEKIEDWFWPDGIPRRFMLSLQKIIRPLEEMYRSIPDDEWKLILKQQLEELERKYDAESEQRKETHSRIRSNMARRSSGHARNIRSRRPSLRHFRNKSVESTNIGAPQGIIPGKGEYASFPKHLTAEDYLPVLIKKDAAALEDNRIKPVPNGEQG